MYVFIVDSLVELFSSYIEKNGDSQEIKIAARLKISKTQIRDVRYENCRALAEQVATKAKDKLESKIKNKEICLNFNTENLVDAKSDGVENYMAWFDENLISVNAVSGQKDFARYFKDFVFSKNDSIDIEHPSWNELNRYNRSDIDNNKDLELNDDNKEAELYCIKAVKYIWNAFENAKPWAKALLLIPNVIASLGLLIASCFEGIKYALGLCFGGNNRDNRGNGGGSEPPKVKGIDDK